MFSGSFASLDTFGMIIHSFLPFYSSFGYFFFRALISLLPSHFLCLEHKKNVARVIMISPGVTQGLTHLGAQQVVPYVTFSRNLLFLFILKIYSYMRIPYFRDIRFPFSLLYSSAYGVIFFLIPRSRVHPTLFFYVNNITKIKQDELVGGSHGKA